MELKSQILNIKSIFDIKIEKKNFTENSILNHKTDTRNEKKRKKI